MFPTFPQFIELDLSQKETYNQFYSRFPPYSDFSFGNLIIWLNQYHDLHIATLNGNIVLECHNLFENGKYVLTLLGDKEIEKTLDALLAYQRESGHTPGLSMVPQTVINNIVNPQKYDIIYERSNANYILDAAQLAALEGSTYAKLRRQINYFEREYAGRFEISARDIESLEEVKKVVNNIHTWDAIYTHNDQERQESYVINTSLKYARELCFKNLSLVVDGSIQAITLYQMIPQSDYVIGNHTKSNYNYRYAFNYLIHKLAQKLYSEGIPYINFEQDLGIAGLREHKMGLRPIHFLDSYSILPKEDNS